MPLEATVICLDGSEYMRNGDYIPTRMEAMRDAANYVCGVKIQMNPENSVGVVACGLPMGPKVLCSCSQDMAALLSACADVRIGGGATDFAKALQVSALALKHRRNKNGDQRIVVFVGSPIVDEEAKLVKLAKNLKKNNIAVDIIAMGEYEVNEGKLKAFMETVDKNSNSNLLVIPAGVLPSEVLMSSPVITGGDVGGPTGGAGGGAGAAAAAFAEYGGVDPSVDPELAMALRASMEEERARLGASAPSDDTAASVVNQNENMPPLISPTAVTEQAKMETDGAKAGETSEAQGDEEEMLRQALLMSMNDQAAQTPAKKDTAVEAEDDEDDEDAEALALALAMSREDDQEAAVANKPPASAAHPSTNPDFQFLDPNYVNELLEGIEGVNMDDPQIQALLQQYPSDKPPSDNPDSKKQKKDGDEKQ